MSEHLLANLTPPPHPDSLARQLDGAKRPPKTRTTANQAYVMIIDTQTGADDSVFTGIPAARRRR
jgi:hypothetical protein